MMKREDAPIQDENIQQGSGDMPEVGCDESHHLDSGDIHASNEVRHDIPKFDLAEQILAAQRKTASFKRTAPKTKDQILKTPDRKSQTTDYGVTTQDQFVSGGQKGLKSDVLGLDSDDSEDKIISEIVARDIQNFRSGRIAR